MALLLPDILNNVMVFLYSHKKTSWCDIDDRVFGLRDKGPHIYCNANYVHVGLKPSLRLNLIQ